MFGGLMKSKLYPHQKENLKFHLTMPRSADFSEMGIGKTLIALAKITHLIAKGTINKVLIICPCSVIPVWEKEIEKHTSLTYITLEGSLLDKGKILNEHPNEDIYIVSYDTIPGRKTTKNVLLKILFMLKFDMIVCDEVTFIKNYETLRFKAVRLLCDSTNQILFLTGTPITNRPDTIFTIYSALDQGETFGKNFYKARNKYFRNIGVTFPIWQIRETMKDELSHKIYTKAVRITKDECLNLPPKIFTPRYCELANEERKVYKPIAAEILRILRIGDTKINIPNALTKLSKLSQICSGFLYGNEGQVVTFSNNQKIKLLEEVLEEIGDEKVIIYTRWREDQRIICSTLERLHKSFRTLSGDSKDRKIPIQDFQEKEEVKILVANIAVGGYALTLTATRYIIYYSLSFALTDWLQSQDRIHRVGQTKTCFYIPLLVRDSIDEYIYESLEHKVDLAKTIIDPERLKKHLES